MELIVNILLLFVVMVPVLLFLAVGAWWADRPNNKGDKK